MFILQLRLQSDTHYSRYSKAFKVELLSPDVIFNKHFAGICAATPFDCELLEKAKMFLTLSHQLVLVSSFFFFFCNLHAFIWNSFAKETTFLYMFNSVSV